MAQKVKSSSSAVCDSTGGNLKSLALQAKTQSLLNYLYTTAKDEKDNRLSDISNFGWGFKCICSVALYLF